MFCYWPLRQSSETHDFFHKTLRWEGQWWASVSASWFYVAVSARLVGLSVPCDDMSRLGFIQLTPWGTPFKGTMICTGFEVLNAVWILSITIIKSEKKTTHHIQSTGSWFEASISQEKPNLTSHPATIVSECRNFWLICGLLPPWLSSLSFG